MSIFPVSIVIPAFNEDATIVETINEIELVLKTNNIEDFEVIVINDGSTDNTEQLLEKMEVKVITHPHNIGYGRSLKDGIKMAQHDNIVIVDADGTYPFYQFPVLLKEYKKGFDMVVGARTGKYYQESFIKATLRKILKFIVEFAAERKIPDINSGFRIFKKDYAMDCLPRLCDAFSFTTSMTLAFMLKGKFVKYINIPYQQRKGKTKVRLLKDSLKTLQYILQAINYYNPLKLFLLFACGCILLSFFFFCIALMTHRATFFSFGIGSALVGLLILSLGLLADRLKGVSQ